MRKYLSSYLGNNVEMKIVVILQICRDSWGDKIEWKRGGVLGWVSWCCDLRGGVGKNGVEPALRSVLERTVRVLTVFEGLSRVSKPNKPL